MTLSVATPLFYFDAFKTYLKIEVKLKEGEHLNNFKLKTQFYLTPEGGLNKKEMLNVFSARTEILEIASQKPYKFNTQKMCQLQCNKSENIKQITMQ